MRLIQRIAFAIGLFLGCGLLVMGTIWGLSVGKEALGIEIPRGHCHTIQTEWSRYADALGNC